MQSKLSNARSRQAAFALLAVLVCRTASTAGPLAGTKPTLPASPRAYGIDFWREAAGLPQSRIRAITQTHDGYIWLGTDNGVVRFNGIAFTSFTIETGSLKDNEVWALREDDDKALWIGTYGGGITRLKDGRFRTFTTADGLPDDVVTRIEKDSSGGLWISTPTALSHYSHGVFSNYGLADGSHFGPLCVLPRGAVFAATASLAMQFNDGRFTPLDGVALESDGAIGALLCAKDDSVWIGFGNSVIKRWKNGQVTTYASERGPTPAVSLLYEDPDGGIWAAYGQRLHNLVGPRFETVQLEDDRTDLGIVYSMAFDHEGGIWTGLQSGGLGRLQARQISMLSSREGLPSDSTRSVFEDRNGAIWVGTTGGVSRYVNDTIVSWPPRNNQSEGGVRSFAEDGQGRLLVGAGKDLLVVQNDRLTPFPGWVSTSEIEVVYKDSRNRIWVATDGNGLCMQDPGEKGGKPFHCFRDTDGLPGNRIRALCEDRQGALWISVFGIGVSRYRDGVFSTFPVGKGPAGNRVADIHEDEEGAMWFATRGGLTRLKDGRLSTFTTASGMLADFVYSILDDGQGYFWFSCAQGLFKVSKSELREFAGGHIRKLTSVVYGVRDGIKTLAFNVGNQPAAWRTAAGVLLFSSMKGVVTVDPGKLITSDFVPPVYIEGVRINRKPQEPASEARVPLGTGEVEIQYAALSYLDPARMRFRYKLEGVDTDWVDAGGRRFAYYANLPPGNFRFRVIAGSVDGRWNEQGATFGFYLTPRFYQTWMFWFAIASAAVFLAWLSYRWHMHELRARYSAVLAERNRISQDMHDTFAQNLAGIALQLDSMTMRLEAMPDGLRERIDAACNLTRYSLAEARRTLTDLRSDGLERADLPVALPDIASRLAGSAGIGTSVQVTGTPRRLNAVTEKNLLRIFQEAMANAVRHSNAEMIHIELNYHSQSLALSVRDNGRGFDADRTIPLGVGHYGVTGMRERAERIGGCLTLKSSPGNGTELLVEVPFSS